MKNLHLTILVCLAVTGGLVRGADLVIEKTGVGKVAVSLEGFSSESRHGKIFRRTLRGNLERSGWFSVSGDVSGATVRVGGKSGEERTGEVWADCEVTWEGGGFRWRGRNAGGSARRLAHELSDEMTRRILNRRGMATSRLVFVGRTSRGSELYMCDADGGDLTRLTSDGALCMSPKWMPDGAGIVYTAYLRRSPELYQITLKNNRRRLLSGFPGLNTGGAASPDGKRVAVVLSRVGNPDLYVMNLADQSLERITRTRHAVESSPTWSPDGERIAYVSDSSGRPQVYVIDRRSRRPKRISFSNVENVSPDWGPDGRIAYSSREKGRYQVYVLDPKTGENRRITRPDADYEDPSWAPDGRHLVCARTDNGRSKLYILDTLGDSPIPLVALEGDWFFPDWSD